MSTDPAYNGLDPADVSLTNHDDDLLLVPLVVAAGGSLVAEGCAPGNGVIDPDETVTVNLALANTGTGPTTALVATLLPTGGVTAPSGPQTYGVLLPGAGAVAHPFTFTAAGTCGGTVAATLQLQDGLTALGTVSFSFTMGVFTGGAPVTFSNAASVTINQASSATPFPSSIGVSGVSGTLTKLTVTLANLSHSFPDDVDILLVGPHNEKVLLLSDAGGGGVASNLSLTFDDGAGAFVPDGGPLGFGHVPPLELRSHYRHVLFAGSHAPVRQRALGLQRIRPQRHLEPVRHGRLLRRLGQHCRRLEPHPHHRDTGLLRPRAPRDHGEPDLRPGHDRGRGNRDIHRGPRHPACRL